MRDDREKGGGVTGRRMDNSTDTEKDCGKNASWLQQRIQREARENGKNADPPLKRSWREIAESFEENTGSLPAIPVSV